MDSVDYSKPVWGKDIFDAVRGKEGSIMACNIRTKASIEGIMRAAMETGSAVLFELAMSETTYTGLTPKDLVGMITSEAKRLGFKQPYAIHGDHITIKDTTPEAFEKARGLLEAEIDAGFTSFAIDASHNFNVSAPTKAEALKDNIDITIRLARIVKERAPRASLEVEVGEIGHKDRETGKQEITTVEEAVAFVDGLKANGIQPDLLAIHNGTEHGNSFDIRGNPIPQLGLDLQRTKEIADALAGKGLVGITQHGTTGTSPENMLLLPEAGIKKINVATHFQNIVMDNLPKDLRARIDTWCLESQETAKERAAEEKKLTADIDPAKRREVVVSKLIKRANGAFKKELEGLDEATRTAITKQTRADSTDFFTRFKSAGTGTTVREHIDRISGHEMLPPDLPPQAVRIKRPL